MPYKRLFKSNPLGPEKTTLNVMMEDRRNPLRVKKKTMMKMEIANQTIIRTGTVHRHFTPKVDTSPICLRHTALNMILTAGRPPTNSDASSCCPLIGVDQAVIRDEDRHTAFSIMMSNAARKFY